MLCGAHLAGCCQPRASHTAALGQAPPVGWAAPGPRGQSPVLPPAPGCGGDLTQGKPPFPWRWLEGWQAALCAQGSDGKLLAWPQTDPCYIACQHLWVDHLL